MKGKEKQVCVVGIGGRFGQVVELLPGVRSRPPALGGGRALMGWFTRLFFTQNPQVWCAFNNLRSLSIGSGRYTYRLPAQRSVGHYELETSLGYRVPGQLELE